MRRFSAVQRHYGPDLLPRNCTAHQVPHAHQVVGRAGKREDPIDFQRSAMPHFAQHRNGLQPAKTFFDALPLLRADGIAPLPRGAAINGAAASSPKVLRHVRRHPNVPALAHEIRRVEALVAAHRHTPASRNFLQHFQRGIALGRARGFPHPAVHNQTVAILHQQIPAVAQLGLLARTFARQLRFWIAFRLVRFVRALLAAIIQRGISRIIRRRRTLLVLGLKTLRAGPGFQQTSVYREVLVRGPSLPSGLLHNQRQKVLGHFGLQQTVAVLFAKMLVPTYMGQFGKGPHDFADEFFHVLTNLCNNGSTLAFLMCFSAMEWPSKGRPNKVDGWVLCWITCLVMVTFCAIAYKAEFGAFKGETDWFDLLAGANAGIALAMFCGRLSSPLIDPPLSVTTLLYLYAVLQISFGFWSKQPTVALIMSSFCLVL